MGQGGEQPVLEQRGEPPFLSAPLVMLRNLRTNRNLLRHLVSRDFKTTYHGHVLGYAWSFLEPLALTAIFYAVFVILRGAADDRLPLTIMIGIMFYQTFSRTWAQTTLSLVRNSGLIKQVYAPREIFLVSTASFLLQKLALSLLIMIPCMIYWNLQPTVLLFLLPIGMLGMSLLGLGLGLITSVIHARIRDVNQLVNITTRAGFFLSGVFYSMDLIPDEWLHVYTWNPMAVFIETARAAIYGDMGRLTSTHIGQAVGIAVAAMLIGSIVFMRFERKAVKYL
jgi:lipopolysaccharide transport system permease protein